MDRPEQEGESPNASSVPSAETGTRSSDGKSKRGRGRGQRTRQRANIQPYRGIHTPFPQAAFGNSFDGKGPHSSCRNVSQGKGKGRSHGKQIFPGLGRGQNSSMVYGHRDNSVRVEKHAESEGDDSLQTLRERLKKQLENDTYECMICCQTIHANQPIWTCSQCYHMFHVNRSNSSGCISQWAAKSFDPNSGWRCPSCQNVSLQLPKQYRCFCGKRQNPPSRFLDTPHSCGATCGRHRGFGCPHPCTEQCHPGPCADCPATVIRACDCGSETKSLRCGTAYQFKCQKRCGMLLECGLHKCDVICHSGKCGPCSERIFQKCYCGLEEREVPCTAENLLVKFYSCGAPCDGKYDCGIHKCIAKCHLRKVDGSCGTCIFSPALKQYCPCGSIKICDIASEPRTSCTDPIPTCGRICNKVLTCGAKEKPHRCKQPCHEGACPPCPNNSFVICRCGSLKETVPCKEAVLYSDSNPLLCVRRCKKLKSCQNHRCQLACCVDTEHVCLQICNKKLDCGNHFCDRLCHVGQCPRCLQASFEEQYCLCGKTVREPPIPCGSPLPPCDAPCSRTHRCSHPPLHSCHAEPVCPPCTVLTEKYCYGKHELRANIPCHLNEVSCGRTCNAPLPCGVHYCKRVCHAPPCMPPEEFECKQACPVKRVGGDCSHQCGLPCHSTSPCPESDCQERIQVTCQCLRRKAEMKCIDVEKAYKKKLAISMIESAEEKPSSGERRILKRSSSADKYRCLPCDSECRLISRNKAVAEALNITTDSDSNRVELNGMSGIASSLYTDFLKLSLKSNLKHVHEVENVLVTLVNEVGMESDRTCQTHAFPAMNSELRRIIHEYAQFFNIETRSYDLEPLRNVVATAKKGECRMPVVLLTAWSAKSGTGWSKNLAGTNMQKINAAPQSKNYSWSSESGMQQLRPVGKVVKRGIASSSRET